MHLHCCRPAGMQHALISARAATHRGVTTEATQWRPGHAATALVQQHSVHTQCQARDEGQHLRERMVRVQQLWVSTADIVQNNRE